MNILTNAIVSNSEMIKNYKTCRDKAENLGKVFVLKNNQPDAVLFSVKEYKRLSEFIEYLDCFDKKDISRIIESLPKDGHQKNYSVDDERIDSK